MNHSKKIKELMELYTDMLDDNEKAKKAYNDDLKKHSNSQYYYSRVVEKPYSEAMLHSVIVIINRLNNR